MGSFRAQVTFSTFSGLFMLGRGGLADADWLTLLRLRVACELVGVLLLSFSAADCVTFSVGFRRGVILFRWSFFAT